MDPKKTQDHNNHGVLITTCLRSSNETTISRDTEKGQSPKQINDTRRSRRGLTCLSDDGKVILPPSSGGRTTENAASRHRRHTQAQTTTSRRSGHRSAPASTRRTISVSSSGSRRDHRSSSTSSSTTTSWAAGSTSGVTFATPPTAPPSEERKADDSQDALRRQDTIAGRPGAPISAPRRFSKILDGDGEGDWCEREGAGKKWGAA